MDFIQAITVFYKPTLMPLILIGVYLISLSICQTKNTNQAILYLEELLSYKLPLFILGYAVFLSVVGFTSSENGNPIFFGLNAILFATMFLIAMSSKYRMYLLTNNEFKKLIPSLIFLVAGTYSTNFDPLMEALMISLKNGF